MGSPNLFEGRHLSTGFVTIGHSNRSPEMVIEMLRDARVNLIADVRAFPRSRSNPGFNIDTFPEDLAAHQIDYRHFRSLGGRRPRQDEPNEKLNAFWRVRSFHNYADYALGDEFSQALCELEQLGQKQRIALMCSEAVWWRCHRRIVVDYLIARGHVVEHLMGPSQKQEAVLSKGAEIRSDGHVVYPTGDQEMKVTPNIQDAPVPLCRHEKLAYRENERRAVKGNNRGSS